MRAERTPLRAPVGRLARALAPRGRLDLVLGIPLVPIAALAVSWLTGWTGSAAVDVATAAVPLGGFLLYPVLAVAAWRRRWGPAVLATLLCAWHLVVVAPMTLPLLGVGDAAAVSRDAVRLRVMTANLREGNTASDRLALQIRSEHPDVLALEEFSWHSAPPLRATGVLDGYPYRVVDESGGPEGIALFARVPLREEPTLVVDRRPMLHAIADVDGQPVHVFVVHTIAPVSTTAAGQWSRQIAAAGALVRQVRGERVVVLGDFNATDAHPAFRQLLDGGGLHDAADLSGDGWSRTWPVTGWLPALVRPDHVLVGAGVGVDRVRVGGEFGSDHRPVIADLALSPVPTSRR